MTKQDRTTGAKKLLRPKLKKYDFILKEINIRPLLPDVTAKINVTTVENLYTSHFFFITRPYVDEERIRRDISRKYQAIAEQTIFTDDMRERKEKDIENAIAAEQLRINELPHAIAFNADIVQMKNKWGSELILRLPTDELQIWLYKNAKYLKDMQLVISDPYSIFVKDYSNVKDIINQEDTGVEFFGVLA